MMRQLFRSRMLFIAIVAASVLYPTNANNKRLQEHLSHPHLEAYPHPHPHPHIGAIISLMNDAERRRQQQAADEIFSGVTSSPIRLEELKRAGLKNVILVQDVPHDLIQFKNMLVKAKIRVDFTLVKYDGLSKELSRKMANPDAHQTLVVDFSPERHQKLCQKFPIIVRSRKLFLQGFGPFAVPCRRRYGVFSKLFDKVNSVQNEVDRIFRNPDLNFSEDPDLSFSEDPDLPFSEETAGQLRSVGIRSVIVLLKVSSKLFKFQERAQSQNFWFYVFPIEEGAKSLGGQHIKWDLPNAFDLAHTFVIDWDRDRLNEISKSSPVVACGYRCKWSSMLPYQPFATESFQMTQEKLNEFIAEKRKKANGELNARELVEFLHKGKIQAVAMRFHGVVVGRRGPLYLSEEEFEEEQKEYTVSDDLKAFLWELRQMGIQFYVVDYSDGRTIKGRHILAGKELITTALDDQEIYPSAIAEKLPFYSSEVHPKTELGPFDTVYHLDLLVKKSKLPPESMLYIDNDLCSCQKAIQNKYPVIYLRDLGIYSRRVQGMYTRRPGFLLRDLSNVNLKGLAEVGPCEPPEIVKTTNIEID